jgi:biopolymer transport protein ExbD
VKLQRKDRPAPKVPLAPMGDIAFLLIIFFMITSVFIKEAHIDVELPGSEDITRLDDGHVAVTMNADGDLWFQGRPCQLEALEDLVLMELERRPSQVVMLKIDRELRQAQFAPVLAALSRTEAEIAWVGDQSD